MPFSDEQMNAVLAKVSENIPSDCATYDTIRKKSLTSVGTLNAKTFDVSDYESYRNDVEFVNSFNEQVLLDEQNYFTKKYSSAVYEFMKAQREKQRIKTKEQAKAAGCNNHCPFDPTRCNDISGNRGGAGSDGRAGAGCKDSSSFLNYLQKQLNMQRAETVYKKIEYRDEAHDFLSTMNHLLTLFYFLILGIMIILLIVTKRLLFAERFILYLFLVALPFLFPYLFEFLKYLFFSLFPEKDTHGPKNAFLENENKGARIESYNI